MCENSEVQFVLYNNLCWDVMRTPRYLSELEHHMKLKFYCRLVIKLGEILIGRAEHLFMLIPKPDKA